MGTVRTIAVQVSEELFQRLKTVIAKKGMKQKDFLIQIIEEHWKRQSRMAEQRQHGRNGTCNRRIWNRRDSTGRGNRTGRRKRTERESEPDEEAELKEESEPDEETQPEEETKAEEPTEW